MRGAAVLVVVLVLTAGVGWYITEAPWKRVELSDLHASGGRVEVAGTVLFADSQGFTLSDVCAGVYVKVLHSDGIPEGSEVVVRGWYSDSLRAEDVKIVRYPQANPQPIGCVLSSGLHGTSLSVSGTVLEAVRTPWEVRATISDGNRLTFTLKDTSRGVDWGTGSVINAVVYMGGTCTVKHWYDITVLSEPHA